jgi:hypothetical protein
MSFAIGMQSTATSAHQDVKQVSKRKQYQPQDGTEEIQVVAGTVIASPIHPREQVESLRNVQKAPS